MGSAKAQYDGIKAFSETDFTEDLKIINVPTLVTRQRRSDCADRCVEQFILLYRT